ncbi:avidin/streptavidin family protein [Chitiniphilus purpureus]|uniref:Avidin/streptavidin family protein n=1 Tax=Chitiniphilus purpureus TaxID=2981137 RepID=A0ABY6DKY3_9NEIS|nr:avidin/streptavidin family protein [Chitiniphilus sp. CD1]UXY14883.1 avidin/streptavidin family protein [Chitiniphilus sp. CD1]
MKVARSLIGIGFGLLALLPGIGGAAEADDSVRSLSAWTNQRGSTLYIDNVSASGQLTGTYINRAAGFGCQNTPYPVTGWVLGNAITFTVLWRNAVQSCNSITAWTGFYYQGRITTLWQLVSNGTTSPGQIQQGQDVFTRSGKAEAETQK